MYFSQSLFSLFFSFISRIKEKKDPRCILMEIVSQMKKPYDLRFPLIRMKTVHQTEYQVGSFDQDPGMEIFYQARKGIRLVPIEKKFRSSLTGG